MDRENQSKQVRGVTDFQTSLFSESRCNVHNCVHQFHVWPLALFHNTQYKCYRLKVKHKVYAKIKQATRNQYASPPRQCNTCRPLERLWRNFVSLL